MSSRVRGVSSSPLLDSGDGTFIRTARLGPAFGVLGYFAAALESFCSFLGRPRFFGSGGGLGLLSDSIATLSGGCSATSGGVSMFSDMCGSSTVSDTSTGSKLTDIFVITYYCLHRRGCGNYTETDMPASHIDRLIVCIAELEINGSQCNAPTWYIVQYVPTVLMG